MIEPNVGGKQRLNDTKSSQSSKDNRKRGESFHQMGNEIKVKENSKVDLIPGLNMQGINSHKHTNVQDRSNFGIVLPNSSSTPRRMISPRGLKSPIESYSKMGFFGSPKAMMGRHKTTGV